MDSGVSSSRKSKCRKYTHLSNQEHGQVLCKEEKEDEAGEHCKSANHGLLEPNPLSNDTGQEQAENLSDERTIGQAGLPRCGDSIGPVFLKVSEASLESWHGVETIDENDIEAFHNDAGREQNGPAYSFWVGLEALQESHRRFTRSGLRRIPSDGIADVRYVSHILDSDARSSVRRRILRCCTLRRHFGDPSIQSWRGKMARVLGGVAEYLSVEELTMAC